MSEITFKDKNGEWVTILNVEEYIQALQNKLTEMEEGIKAIERLVDNQNPSHEQIWRIANNLINEHTRTK